MGKKGVSVFVIIVSIDEPESSNISFWPSVACKLPRADVWKIDAVEIFVKHFVVCSDSGPSKVIAVGLLTVGGGIGGTILYAKWDNKFRAAVEKNVPYSDRLFGLALGASPGVGSLPVLKKVRIKTRLAAATQKNTKTPLRPLEEALSHREDAPDDGAVHHKAVLFRTSVSVMSRMIISACDDISGVCCHG